MKKVIVSLVFLTWGQVYAAFKVDAGNFTFDPATSQSKLFPSQYIKAGCTNREGMFGNNVMPTVKLSDIPAGTKSFALIMDDPDGPDIAGNPWVHWVVFNIPGTTTQLGPDNLESLPGLVQGTNTWEHNYYEGPCPPPGSGIHTYYITVYALDTLLDLTYKATKADVFKAIQGHILGQTAATGEMGL